MALVKQEVTQPIRVTFIAEATAEQLPQTQPLSYDPSAEPAQVLAAPPEEIQVDLEPQALAEPVAAALVVPVNNTPLATITPEAALQDLAGRGFEGLAYDWTSFPSISLKLEGFFEDFDGQNYDKEFTCHLRGSKERRLYRTNPVLDNKKDVKYSYDGVVTQDGLLVEDVKREWLAAGRVVEDKLYIEAMVEMVAPGEAYDGRYRILSISPKSRGRFTEHTARCAALGRGDPGVPLTKVLVGAKITKVTNPFYPWAFEVVRT